MVHGLLWLSGLLIFLVAITLSIGLHEAGHMVTAKVLGVPVRRFFVGFGPTLWSKTWRGTEYGAKALPLGGFVSIEDERLPVGSFERGFLSQVAPWKRFLIFVAGPAVNLLLGLLILYPLLLSVAVVEPTVTVASVTPCGEGAATCAASRAGLQPGDRFLRVEGQEVTSFQDIRSRFRPEGTRVTVARGEATEDLLIKGDEQGKAGMQMALTTRPRGAGEAASSLGHFFLAHGKALLHLPEKVGNLLLAVSGQEERSQDTVSSVVAVGNAYGNLATTEGSPEGSASKAQLYLLYTALFNLGIGFANLLPLLPLDGGRMVISIIDQGRLLWAKALRKSYRPLAKKWIMVPGAITTALVMSFMVLTIVADFVVPVTL